VVGDACVAAAALTAGAILVGFRFSDVDDDALRDEFETVDVERDEFASPHH
jgi:CBS-domain-containing membrane protein